MVIRSLLHLLFVAVGYEKISLWLWKSMKNSVIFFSYFVTTLPAMCVHNWPRKVLESH